MHCKGPWAICAARLRKASWISQQTKQTFFNEMYIIYNFQERTLLDQYTIMFLKQSILRFRSQEKLHKHALESLILQADSCHDGDLCHVGDFYFSPQENLIQCSTKQLYLLVNRHSYGTSAVQSFNTSRVMALHSFKLDYNDT